MLPEFVQWAAAVTIPLPLSPLLSLARSQITLVFPSLSGAHNLFCHHTWQSWSVDCLSFYSYHLSYLIFEINTPILPAWSDINLSTPFDFHCLQHNLGFAVRVAKQSRRVSTMPLILKGRGLRKHWVWLSGIHWLFPTVPVQYEKVWKLCCRTMAWCQNTGVLVCSQPPVAITYVSWSSSHL